MAMMMGRFNNSLNMSSGKLTVAGTLTDCTPGRVEIKAGVTQKGEVVSCHDTFTVPASGNLSWSMDVSASSFVTGTDAAGSALATGSGGSVPWDQADIWIT